MTTTESLLRLHLRAAHGIDGFDPDSTEESLREYHEWDHDTGEMGPAHDAADLTFGVGDTYEVTVPVEVSVAVAPDGTLTVTGFAIPLDIGDPRLFRAVDDEWVSVPVGSVVADGVTGDEVINAAVNATEARVVIR